MPPTTITLTCLEHGRDPERLIIVEIEISKTVIALKEAIKDQGKETFRSVDADMLDLWKVSIPLDDERFDEQLKNLNLNASNLIPLTARKTLSSYFSEKPPNCLDIIIRTPSNKRLDPDPRPFLTLACLGLGESVSRIFLVEIASTQTVADLRDAIKEKKKNAFQHVDAKTLDLYKVSLPVEKGFQEEARMPDGDPLSPLKMLSEIFHEPLASNELHIIVNVPANNCQLRKDFLKDSPPKPLLDSVPEEFSTRQKNKNTQIYCNRPYNVSATIPVTLLHPIFGQFIDDCENYEPTPDDNHFVLTLSVTMSDLYETELERANAVRCEFSEYGIHFEKKEIPGTDYGTECDISNNGYCCSIITFKNEVVGGNAEPFFRSIFHYLESTRNHAVKETSPVLPCMTINIFGPYMSFVGVAWTDRPVVQVLSNLLQFHFHPSDTTSRAMAARHLGAFKKAIHRLKNYYDIDFPLLPPSTPSRSFPYQDHFTLRTNSTKRAFEYISQLYEDQLLFRGKLKSVQHNNHDICIKFTRSYSPDVHAFCADHGYAPNLLGYEILPGGWWMVVMELIDEQDYVEVHKLRDHLDSSVLEELSNFLDRLHRAGFVHGDIRETNIMVPKSGKGCPLLVNFDWSGKLEEVRYPMNVRQDHDLWRPDGACDGQLIAADHDQQMLTHLVNLYFPAHI